MDGDWTRDKKNREKRGLKIGTKHSGEAIRVHFLTLGNYNAD